MCDLATAISIACDAHRDQVDKSGKPYILHPLRVMLAMDTTEEQIVAVLHDVAEDCEDGWLYVHDGGFNKRIIAAVDALTRRKAEGETYVGFIKRLKRNPLARKVKLADIADNTDPSRADGLSDSLRARYAEAAALLRAEEETR
jgi:(p)ppGpp synthase/HD superfamily hydrolase